MVTGEVPKRKRKRELQPKKLQQYQPNPRRLLSRQWGRLQFSNVQSAPSLLRRLDSSMYTSIPPMGECQRQLFKAIQLLFYREDKPSVLDMSEAVIARLQEKAGAPKDKILKVTLR